MRIAFVAPDDWTVWLFYRHLVRALTATGARITVLSAGGAHMTRLRELGIEHQSVPYARYVNPGRDVHLFWTLRRALSRGRFDLVQNFTIKANLYGALAAWASGVRAIVNTVEGAGLLYAGRPGTRIRMIRAIAELGLRRLRTRVSRYWFVNPHDRDVFVRRGLAAPERSVVAIATGVDTRQFDPAAVSPGAIVALRRELRVAENVPLVAAVVGRLLHAKGIAEFLEMARRLRRSGVAAQAVLVGPEEPDNLDAFPVSLIRAAHDEGVIRWIPFREDVWTIYAAADVVAVPTYYGEGTPRAVMESMAMGRAVVCADIPATRHLVAPGQDCVLVPPARADDLADAVAALLSAPERRAALERAARATALARFDAERAAEQALRRVYAGLPGWPAELGCTA